MIGGGNATSCESCYKYNSLLLTDNRWEKLKVASASGFF